MVMEVEKEKEEVMETPGEVLGYSSTLIPGKGAYLHNKTIYASLTGRRVIIPPSSDSPDQKRSIVEVTGHKAHGAAPEPGSIVIARVTKVMAKMASADIMCVGTKSVKEKFSGVITYQKKSDQVIDPNFGISSEKDELGRTFGVPGTPLSAPERSEMFGSPLGLPSASPEPFNRGVKPPSDVVMSPSEAEKR